MPVANRYQVIAPLARGGMGEVMLARRLGPAGFEKLVVLKRPLPSSGARDLVAALIEEARLLARVNHPNVCQVYDLERAGDQYFLTLEYLEGLSMWSMLGAQTGVRGIAPGAVCGLFEQACDGLDAIHTMQLPDGGRVVHRDISPGNLFVTERGVVKVLDLGIAKSSAAEQQTPFRQVVGKLSYMSPEQASGLPLDPRSDLFSLGLVLYDMLRGRLPSRDRIGARAVEAIDFTAMPSPLGDVVRRAVAKQPTERFATAREMAAALHDAGSSLGGSWTPRELAAWLAERHGPELAHRRAIVEVGPGSQTQILDLRSVFAGPPELDSPVIEIEVEADAEIEVEADAEIEAAPASHGLNPTGSPTVREPSGTTASGPPSLRRSGWRRRAWLVTGITAVTIGLGGWSVARRLGDGAAAGSLAALEGLPARPATSTPATAAELAAVPVATVPVAPAPDARTPATAAPAFEVPSPAARAPGARAATPPPPEVVPPRPPRAPARSHPVRRTGESSPSGQLTIESSPFAEIWLGSRDLGTTPLWRIPLPPGQYELHAVTADGHRQNLGLAIEPGRERRMTLRWSAP
jgi:serine/threonine-protein kinase